MVFAVMLTWIVFRTSVRAAALLAQGIAEIGTWMALAGVGAVMACEWALRRPRPIRSRVRP